MNDSQEDIYGINQVAYYLEQRASGRAAAESKFLRNLAETFRRGPGGSFRYVFCTSEEPDLLSQWRGYTPRGGYSIGFRVESLHAIAARNGLSLSACTYTDAEHHALIERQLGPILERYVSWDITETEIEKRTRTLLSASEAARSVIKHPSFAEEREWRLYGSIRATDQRCNWRPAGAYVRPYAEIGLLENVNPADISPIAEVRIGPGLDKQRGIDGLQHLFSGVRTFDLRISCSAAPLRS